MRVECFEAVISGAAVLRVCAGTNCPQGGDGGHGGRTVLELEDLGSTAWCIGIAFSGGSIEHYKQPQKVRLIFEGDSELETFLQTLEFVAQILKNQYKVNKFMQEKQQWMKDRTNVREISCREVEVD